MVEKTANKFARHRVSINLANNDIEVGDELRIKIDAKRMNGSNAYIAVVWNNSLNNILKGKAFANTEDWQKLSTKITVPEGAETIDIFLYADYARGQGSSMYKNLIIKNLDGCATQTVYYADADGDGFGDYSTSISACTKPIGYVTNSDDCDDTNADVYPNAPELV